MKKKKKKKKKKKNREEEYQIYSTMTIIIMKTSLCMVSCCVSFRLCQVILYIKAFLSLTNA